MSWTEVFPVMTDEMVFDFISGVSPEHQSLLDRWLGIEMVYNEKANPKHLISTCLFWKRDYLNEGELPVISRESIVNAEALGLIGRYAPWESYALPLLEGAKSLREESANATLRVYLANDLSFLIDELADAGCEVHLMKSSSIRHNPGAMWRFLALENASDTCPVTITDSDRLKDVLSDLARTEAAQKVGVGGWRVPYDFKGSKEEGYRPMSAAQFGSMMAYPMQLLMEAFIWHNLNDTMPTTVKLEGLRENQIVGTIWPDYGFDEWFLLAVMYPRMAQNGLLTFFPWDKDTPGQFYTLDIEYCTWANPKSELINYPNPELALGDVIRPWAEWKDEARLRVRTETTVVKRPRRRIGPHHGILNHRQRNGIEKFPKFAGELSSFLIGASADVTEPWWVDLNPQLRLSSDGGELFLDRRYDEADVVFCGYYFIKINASIAEWARSKELDERIWSEGKLLKVPKLEGPMTLWRTEFSRKFHEDLAKQVPLVKAEILMRAWMDQGKVNTAETTAKQMGWKVR
jgi:hypothetical protein